MEEGGVGCLLGILVRILPPLEESRRLVVIRWLIGWATLALFTAFPVAAQDLITEKKVFELPTFTTQSGKSLNNVKVGWESYGTLNADKSNAILICHFFSATSHAAGKYTAADAAPGYWDAIIGPGKRSIPTGISSCLRTHWSTSTPTTRTSRPPVRRASIPVRGSPMA
jgi:homoserine O-acetyltransferase